MPSENREQVKEKLRTGEKLGRYEIKKSIGAGGMGAVYLARDSKLERLVALKILPDAFAEDRERVRRFIQEAKAASALNHPNILTIYEIGSLDNVHFIATEFIEGETLRNRMKRGSASPLDLRETLDIAAQVAAALNAAHMAGIIHRDIKPENIMLREDRLVKVLDFGLVKLVEKTGEAISHEDETLAQINTQPGMIMGTVAYMSPEQARGKSADARSDLWSLGVVLYEMVAARQPFTGETASDTIASILKSEPDSLQPNVPPELQRIVTKSLQKNAEERYQTAKGFLEDLKNLQRELEFAEDRERVNISGSTKTANLNFTSGENQARDTSAASQNSFPSHISYTKRVFGKDKRNKFVPVGILAAIVLAIVSGYFALFSANRQAINAVAVLPFVNGSNDANLDYLSDGLSERLIDSLSQLPQLKVISRSSSFKYRGDNVDLQQVAKTLGVQAVIVGRVVQRGDTLTVRAELIDCREGTQNLWSDQFVRKAADLQSVQENIVQTVSENLRLKLSGVQEQRLAKHATQSAEAYQIYLNGLFYQRKGGKENTRKALDFYNQAIALDANFALAYTQAAGVYNSLGGSGELNPKEAIPKAKEAAQKALTLDETLAEAHSVLAVIKRFEWDWAGTETELRRAIELNPNLAAAHSNYAIYLSNMERHNEALAEIKRAQEIDPLWIGFQIAEGGILMNARRYDEAVKLLQDIIKMNPDSGGAHEYLGYVYNAKKMYQEAVNEFQAFYRIEGDTIADKAFLGFAYAKLGRRNEAQNILNQLKTTSEYVSPAELAILYAGLDDREAAFAALERAFAEHDLQLQFLRVESSYDSLRADARFQDLTRRVGLAK